MWKAMAHTVVPALPYLMDIVDVDVASANDTAGQEPTASLLGLQSLLPRLIFKFTSASQMRRYNSMYT
jgi:hypothetical protein